MVIIFPAGGSHGGPPERGIGGGRREMGRVGAVGNDGCDEGGERSSF